MSVQTSMHFGQPHYSVTHQMHTHGSQAPVQQDLQLKLPNGNMHSSIGMPFRGQTTLPMFGIK
jgi:hypothetical protein